MTLHVYWPEHTGLSESVNEVEVPKISLKFSRKYQSGWSGSNRNTWRITFYWRKLFEQINKNCFYKPLAIRYCQYPSAHVTALSYIDSSTLSSFTSNVLFLPHNRMQAITVMMKKKKPTKAVPSSWKHLKEPEVAGKLVVTTCSSRRRLVSSTADKDCKTNKLSTSRPFGEAIFSWICYK